MPTWDKFDWKGAKNAYEKLVGELLERDVNFNAKNPIPADMIDSFFGAHSEYRMFLTTAGIKHQMITRNKKGEIRIGPGGMSYFQREQRILQDKKDYLEKLSKI